MWFDIHKLKKYSTMRRHLITEAACRIIASVNQAIIGSDNGLLSAVPLWTNMIFE